MTKSKLICCFCGKDINNEQIKRSFSLIALANWYKKELEQEQQFFCHLECFKNTLNNNIPFYIEYLIE